MKSSPSQEQIRVDITEFVNQSISYNPLTAGSGLWTDEYEVSNDLEIVGYINISNMNQNGVTISDLYVTLDNVSRTTTPLLYEGREGTISLSNDLKNYIIHIPELKFGENSIWQYSVNETISRPPLNVSTKYSQSKILAGESITVTDMIINVFDMPSYNSESCIYGIRYNQTTVPVNFSNLFYNFSFNKSTLVASDDSAYSNFTSSQNMYWDVRNGECLNFDEKEQINYTISAPFNIPKTSHYNMTNSILSYTLNSTISHLRVDDVIGVSEGIKIKEEKKIVEPSDTINYGSNVTWNATGYLESSTDITYKLNSFTMWVAKREGIAGDPNTIDNDTISNVSLLYELTPNMIVNKTLPFVAPSWFFNYSDLPTPILYSKADFTIANDGAQLINRTFTRNQNEVYIKELYLIMGYWLDIEKNISAAQDKDTYTIRIDVHNKGNQVTPGNAIVTVYDFVPSEFEVVGSMNYQLSSWYDTASGNNTVSGDEYNGTLYQWGIIPMNVQNTSLAQGPDKNENTTWSVEFNVTGDGDYDLLDVFITGLDPQKVDGASASKQVFVTEFVNKFRSTEGIFAAIAGLMLILGLVV